MKSYKKLVSAVLADGHVVSVFDGECWAVKKSSDKAAIIAAIESVEQAELLVRNADGDALLWALVLPCGVGDDETVADHSDNAYADELLQRGVL